MTTLSVDTGDLETVRRMVDTGLITDATTNPLFVSQAGQSGNPLYQEMVDEAVRYAVEECWDPDDPHGGRLGLAVDRLAVNLGASIASIVPGYISTEVNIKYAFDTMAMHTQACRILSMYSNKGVPTSRVLIKLPGTWEGIQAARKLEATGFKTNITLVFGLAQAIAAAQAGAHLISPFPGRVLEWHKANDGYPEKMPVEDDPGVASVKQMHCYYKAYGYETILMPASWRSPTGEDPLDEVLALAGVDRMTIPPALLDDLAARGSILPRRLSPEQGKADCEIEKWDELGANEFRWKLSMDGATNDKLAAGIRAFASDTYKLEDILRNHKDMDLVNF
ncbi:transaldolase [Chloropicon primus]|nr:transaldolase [Chloropicon primus]